jgi:hypothetical protein
MFDITIGSVLGNGCCRKRESLVLSSGNALGPRTRGLMRMRELKTKYTYYLECEILQGMTTACETRKMLAVG